MENLWRIAGGRRRGQVRATESQRTTNDHHDQLHKESDRPFIGQVSNKGLLVEVTGLEPVTSSLRTFSTQVSDLHQPQPALVTSSDRLRCHPAIPGHFRRPRGLAAACQPPTAADSSEPFLSKPPSGAGSEAPAGP
jgi:hypothetical protein